MKLIPLTQGKFAQVDDDDYEFLMQWKWYATKYKYTWYAMRSSFKETKTNNKIWMHRVILKITDKKIQGDHRDHNGLNNQKSNLRTATQTQNNANRRFTKKRSSQYTGVIHRIKRKKYEAVIKFDYKLRFLGMFENEIDAAKAYNQAAIKYFGDFARLNQIPINV